MNPELVGDYWHEYDFYNNLAYVQTSTEPELVLEGPADTGKTLAMCYLLNRLAWRFPGAQIMMVRKWRATMFGTVLQTFMKKVLIETPRQGFYEGGVRAVGGQNPSLFQYPNGSTIWIAGLDKAEKILSAERDVIYVNQAEELSKHDWETLKTRASGRAGNMPYGQLLGDCNPASPTHYLQQRKKAGLLKMLPTTHRDNPSIFDPVTGELTETGKQRIETLQGLTGARKQRLYYGLWAQPEGAIYELFDEARHKVQDFTVPAHWPRFVGVDPLGAYVCALWVAWDPDNQKLNVYREYYEPFGVSTPKHAEAILKLSGFNSQGYAFHNMAENIFAWVGGGPSENQARLDWSAAGIPLVPSPLFDVWAGIDKVNQLLGDNALVIHESCGNLLSEIGEYKRTLKNGEPTDTIESKDMFHALDALRYIIGWLTFEPNQQVSLVRIT